MMTVLLAQKDEAQSFMPILMSSTKTKHNQGTKGKELEHRVNSQGQQPTC